MKKIFPVLAIMLTGILLVGCGGSPEAPDNPPAGNPSVDASVDEIIEAVKARIIEDLEEIGYGEEEFEIEELPGYVIGDLTNDEEIDFVLPQLDRDLIVAGFQIRASMMLNSDQIIVIEAAEGELDAVREVLEAEHAAQLEMWQDYLADQAEKVENIIFAEAGNFILYAIYPDAEGIEAVFNQFVQ
ncbi:MAG: DUF4358 domain-containing protein [Firmicutes bacterium]|nr:DUF4358 domain-containing protein [Bacillota bacterium]